MKTRALLLVVLVLFAGCGGSVQETETTTISTTTQATTTTEQTATTSTTTSTETKTTETTTPKPANPWNKENVTVTIRYKTNESRDITPLVNETLDYWNNHSDEYGAYSEITFVSTPNQRFSDIVIEVVPEIESCGEEDTDNTVGCAPVLEEYDSPTIPEYVQVTAGYSDESTKQILKHEFGHVMGIEHGEDPMPLMEPMHKHTYLSQPDVSERVLPWKNSTLSVFVDTENVTLQDQDDVNEQIDYSLSYFEGGADGSVPENVSFTRTENRSTADIRISVPDDGFDCGGERMREGSCGTFRAYDTDTDDAFEYYSRWDIRVRNIDEDAVGWHVGYWLANAFGLEGDELPEPFVDANYRDRRSDWWE